MNKHTPGPWKIWKFQRADKLESVRQEIGTVNDGTPICQLTGHIANAQLISAAPELLEALEQAYLQIVTFLNEGDFKRDVVFDAGYIVDALAKAKGEYK